MTLDRGRSLRAIIREVGEAHPQLPHFQLAGEPHKQGMLGFQHQDAGPSEIAEIGRAPRTICADLRDSDAPDRIAQALLTTGGVDDVVLACGPFSAPVAGLAELSGGHAVFVKATSDSFPDAIANRQCGNPAR